MCWIQLAGAAAIGLLVVFNAVSLQQFAQFQSTALLAALVALAFLNVSLICYLRHPAVRAIFG